MTEQAPYDTEGHPFPTTYYLTCRSLVAAVSRLEAAGGVEYWTSALERSPALRSDLDRATSEQRVVRRSLAGEGPRLDGGASLDTGIGGSRNVGQLKCLHAHVAFALAHPGYLLGEAVADEVARAEGSLWPAHCCAGAGETG